MRLHRLDLNLLVVLDLLLTERSVSQTALQLHLSQSAISNALARLRLHFEDDLFVQVGRRLQPTPFAEGLADAVHAAVEDLRRIATRRADFDFSTVERTFTVICSDYSFQVLISRVIQELSSIAPGIRLTAFLTSEQTPEHLQQGRADFAIVPSSRNIPDHPGAPLFTESFSCIAWEGNPLIGDTLTRETFLGLEHIGTCLGPTNPPRVEQQALDAQGVVRRFAAFAPNFTSVPDAVVGTPYIATVHSRTAALSARRLPIRVFPLPVEIPPMVESLQWHKNRGADPGVIWMRDFMLKIAAEV